MTSCGVRAATSATDYGHRHGTGAGSVGPALDSAARSRTRTRSRPCHLRRQQRCVVPHHRESRRSARRRSRDRTRPDTSLLDHAAVHKQRANGWVGMLWQDRPVTAQIAASIEQLSRLVRAARSDRRLVRTWQLFGSSSANVAALEVEEADGERRILVLHHYGAAMRASGFKIETWGLSAERLAGVRAAYDEFAANALHRVVG